MTNMNDNRKYFTGSFFNYEINFVIENLISKDHKIELPYSFYMTEKNLLRGIKLKPSNYLSKKMAEYYPNEELDFEKVPYLIDKHYPKWTDSTILGNPSDKNDNPAFEFYKNLEKDLGAEYAFIINFIMPEFEIVDFCEPLKKHINNKTRVDFFIPHCSLVIEVDGKQHREDSDRNRDEALEEFFIKTIRITTDEIRNRDDRYFSKIEDIKNKINKSVENLLSYNKSLELKLYKKESYVYTSIAIHRFQILLCELIKSGKLNLTDDNWKLQISHDFICSFDWVSLAIEDFFNWLTPISEILHEKIKKPKNINILINSSKYRKDFLKIEINLFQRPSEKNTKNISVKSWYIDKVITKSRPNLLGPNAQIKSNEIYDYLDYYTESINANFNKQINIPISDSAKKGLEEFLLQSYGHINFKDGQFRIIERILAKENTLGLLPTGGGKSLCFQLPSSLSSGCCIIVCPIIALMKDHKEELERMGYGGRVETITMETDPSERNQILDSKIPKGLLNYIFVSPERFQNKEFRNSILALSNKKLISYIVIDEVHCISEWGHDFRPSYLVLANTIFSILKLNVPIISLTATASQSVLADIRQELKLEQEDVIYRMDNSRQELNFHIEYTESKVEENPDKVKKSDKYPILLKTIDRIKNSNIILDKDDAGIIFTMFVNYSLGCLFVQQELKKDLPKLRSAIFSGSEPDKWVKDEGNDWFSHKAIVQKEYKNNNLDMMIATKAFGMGINKQNIRYSIHYGMPASLEALYQEAGRCGRDGKKSENVIIFSNPLKIPDKILDDPTTNIKTIEEFNEENKYITSDYIKQLRLMFLNKTTVKEEAEECLKNYQKLLKPSNKRGTKVDEIYLYRLFQLGLVSDWTVVDAYRGEYDAPINDISDRQIADNVLEQICKYEVSEVGIKKHKDEIDKLLLTGKEKIKKNLLWYLIKWSNDQFLYNRRRSLATLYRYCIDFNKTKDGPANFKKKIDAYFRVDNVAESISKKIDINHSEAPKELKAMLLDKDKVIEKEKVNNIIFTITRFLESYRSNPWLDLLSSMCRLITDSFDDPDGKVRLYKFVEDAKENEGNWRETLTGLLEFAQYLSLLEREELSKVLCAFINDQDELFLVHKYLGDNYSALIFMSKINKRIRKIL
jgi:ATP-dependent DNA helicase RecQ